MEYCKLQIGCLFIFLYIILIYYREKINHHQRYWTIYDILLCVAFFCLVLDGFTVYLVNHLDKINPLFNKVMHGLFLSSIDTLIVTLFVYIFMLTQGLPQDRKNVSFLDCLIW